MAGSLLLRVVGSVVAMGVLAACQKALSTAGQRPLATLAGTEWGFAKTAEDTPERFVAFKTGGEVIGTGGCNRFFGNFYQDGRALTFGPLASTKKLCPPPVMAAERELLDLLGKVRAADATHLELTLYGADDAVLAVLQRRDWD